jgi:hydrogenase maturation protease
MKTLLIGMGNPILTDDAVGVRLATDIKARLGDRADIDFLQECSVGGLNLLELVAGYERLIVIDSIRTRGGVPGNWYSFDGTALKETMNLNNIHDTNFATAVELGRRMGMQIPDDDRIHIWAVEVKENSTFSDRMTPALETGYAEISEEIFREIEDLLNGDRQVV